ncbi:hypothetical protein [Schlesneria paludicola]|uniref:hypothetical protein n=1 Tax=Schlesneria paludicola TaxID=360056 RepID=UPI00029B1CCD|nr:hypothetical protein [Schlesneria paludicola]
MTTEPSCVAARRTHSLIRSLFVSASMIGLISLPGCGGGPAGPKREAVSGTVTREGVDVDSGTVTFEPQGGGPAATASITDGKYKLDTKTGPVAGKQKVIIVQNALRDFKEGVPKKEAALMPDTRFKKKMPPTGWVKEAEIQAGQKEPIDFHIDS